MWQSFVSAMVAAVTLQVGAKETLIILSNTLMRMKFMNPFRTGKLVMYQVKYSRGWHGFELIPFCILGILGVGMHNHLAQRPQR